MDLEAWAVQPATGGVNIELFFDDQGNQHGTGGFFVPEWMATVFANAILGDLEFARRTRRDDGRRMVQSVFSQQVFCEPCNLEIDAPGMPAITRPHGGPGRCVVCGFTRRSNAGEADARAVGVDQGADTR